MPIYSGNGDWFYIRVTMINMFKVSGANPKFSAMQNDQNLWVLIVKEWNGRVGVSRDAGEEFSIEGKVNTVGAGEMWRPDGLVREMITSSLGLSQPREL